MIYANKNIILVKNRMVVKLIDPCLAREVTSIVYTDATNKPLSTWKTMRFWKLAFRVRRKSFSPKILVYSFLWTLLCRLI